MGIIQTVLADDLKVPTIAVRQSNKPPLIIEAQHATPPTNPQEPQKQSAVLSGNGVQDLKNLIPSMIDNIKKQASGSAPDDLTYITAIKQRIVIKEANIPALEAEIGDWNVLTMKDDKDKKVCYIVSYPFDKVDNHTFLRKPYLMVAFDEKKRISVYTTAGYVYCKNSDVSLSVDGRVYNLMSQAYIAITKTGLEDLNIVQSMLEGKRIYTNSRSVDGTYSVDTYSLDGFLEAYNMMMELCK